MATSDFDRGRDIGAGTGPRGSGCPVAPGRWPLFSATRCHPSLATKGIVTPRQREIRGRRAAR